jgi:hypothetical protein
MALHKAGGDGLRMACTGFLVHGNSLPILPHLVQELVKCAGNLT